MLFLSRISNWFPPESFVYGDTIKYCEHTKTDEMRSKNHPVAREKYFPRLEIQFNRISLSSCVDFFFAVILTDRKVQQTSRDNTAPNTLNRHQFANTRKKTMPRSSQSSVRRPLQWGRIERCVSSRWITIVASSRRRFSFIEPGTAWSLIHSKHGNVY